MMEQQSNHQTCNGHCKTVSEQFQRKNFLLEHNKPHIFGEPQIGGIHAVYVGYRLFLAVYTVIVVIMGGVVKGPKLLKYFTYWSYILLTFSLCLQAGNAIYHFYLVRKQGSESVERIYRWMPVHTKITWVFFNISYGSAFIITPLYWGFLYFRKDPMLTMSFQSVNSHAVNMVIVIIDSFITGIPVRLLHFWHGMVYGTLYIIFWGLWYAAGKGDIYKGFIGWNQPHKALGILIPTLVVGSVVTTLICWILFTVRLLVYDQCKAPSPPNCARDQEDKNQQNNMLLMDSTV